MTSASIPSRRTLNVQLGPAAAATGDDDSTYDVAPPVVVEERRAPRRTPRIRWSRMAAPPGQPPAAPPPPLEPPPSMALLAAGTAGAASLCQLVDFGETRDLIRRQRESAKQLEELNSIVDHLSLDRENTQDSRSRQSAGWATFRRQPNSQFKQYVFQSPGQAPALPPADTDEAAALWQRHDQHHLQHHQHHHHPQQQQQHLGLQKSRTTLGLVSGRPVARHSRPAQNISLSREVTRTSMAPGGQAGFRLQGYSSVMAHDAPDSLYGQFAHRKSKSFRLA